LFVMFRWFWTGNRQGGGGAAYRVSTS
jgi:hypothetical protein